MFFVPSDTNNDNYQVISLWHPGCGLGNSGGYNLAAPHRYRMTLSTLSDRCWIDGKAVDAPTIYGESFTQIG
jgi:hypothetical protein